LGVGLELLWEPSGLPAFALPAELAGLYPGTLGFEGPCVFANFVETLDGVVAIPSIPSSNAVVAGKSEADRFLLGLLRACADVVMIGAGTQAASPKSIWTPEQAYPPAAAAYAELRRALGKPPGPEVVVLTRSGQVEAEHPAFAAGAIVITTSRGRERITLAEEQVIAVGEELEPHTVIDVLRARGHELILSEGGPTAIGSFLAAGLIDELFLTLSPVLTGRIAGDPRLGLVEQADLLPGGPPHSELRGVRRNGNHLFLRYLLT
jgi:riboflavin biosynthesis pyrimidine reductase